MTWIFLIALHLRAAWAGFAYTHYSDLAGLAQGQIFFLGVVMLLALIGRISPRAARWMPIPVAALAFGLVLASWMARASGDTFRVFGAESSKTHWNMLLSSALATADPLLALDTLLALAAVAGAFAGRRRRKPLGRQKAVAIAAVAAALIFLGAAHEPKDLRLESPWLALIRARGAAALPFLRYRVKDLRALKYGTVTITKELRHALAERREALCQPGRPNIVLIFLESTGSGQIAPKGQLDPHLTPTISSLGSTGVFFPSVYAPFPGTIRSHLSVMTGGEIITWGSVFKELSHRYLGPTLPGELKSRGYRTGFFSAAYLNSENMDGFYDLLPFDERFMPERMPKQYRLAHSLNSWGIDDREVEARALAWAKSGPGPFFLAFNVDATHHPYDIPAGFPKFKNGNDYRTRFDNALHFVDSVVGRLADGLRAAGLDNTLFVILGDHGEAFGDIHPGNFTHRNFIYEENVRSFLIIANLKAKVAPLRADFPASNGAVLPTVLELVDRHETPGSLFEPKGEIQYFYKNTYPELWGLRDGEWKFIAPIRSPDSAELFRLDQDSVEAHNIAAQYPSRVKEYRDLVTQWYLDSEDEFTAQLQNYRFDAGEGLKAEDLQTPGPKRLAFGTIDEDGNFTPATEVSRTATIAAYTKDIPYPKARRLLYRWHGPDGSEHETHFTHEETWSDVYVYPQDAFVMGPGRWKLEIFDGAQELIHGQFMVTQ